MTNLSKDELASLVAAVVTQIMQGQNAGSKPASMASPVDRLVQRDAAIRAGFTRRGIKDVVLMNRDNPAAEYNVRPYQQWLAKGYQVRKGERSVKGLFHQSQCDLIAKAKPAITTEQKTLFDQAKKAFKAKKAKALA
jgi:hypothetical protein